MMRSLRWFALLGLMLSGGEGAAHAVDLVAGPMIGHVTDHTARVWMQFPVAGEVTIYTYELGGTRPSSALKVGLEGPIPFTCDVPLGGLEPDHSYRLEVKFDNEPVRLPEVVIRTAPVPGDEATFSVAFGSGLETAPMPPGSASAATRSTTAPAARATPAAPSAPIFRAICDLKPRAFFYLGNTGQLPASAEDFPPTHRAAFRYISDFHSRVRREPGMQELLHTTPCYGLFNDRDFGPRDADARFIYAQESLVAFQRFWPNPDWGAPEHPGCYCTFTLGDADFFFLDTRTFRDSSLASKPMLGGAQMEWLKQGLGKSRAHFKVLAAPCDLWSGGGGVGREAGDSWKRFPEEQQEFVQWLADHRIDGLLTLAGCRPEGELTFTQPETSGGKLRYPMFTLACSTLNSGAAPGPIPTASARPPQTLPGERRVGEAVVGNSFGTLSFAGEGEHRFATLQLHDASGKVRAEQVLFALQLRN